MRGKMSRYIKDADMHIPRYCKCCKIRLTQRQGAACSEKCRRQILSSRDKDLEYRAHLSKIKKGRRPTGWELCFTNEAKRKRRLTFIRKQKLGIHPNRIYTPKYGRLNPNYKGPHRRECLICGISFIVQIPSEKTKTCSKICWQTLCSVKKQNIDPAQWRGFRKTLTRRIAARLRARLWSKGWQRTVLQRDGAICQLCHQPGRILEAHHILTWQKHPTERYDIDNGITLCRECHKRIRFQEDEYSPLFKTILLNQKLQGQITIARCIEK
jgi:5-methylcytosine-specific restriction endonuclease McrA